ncbi:MAG: acetate kinase [Verrucomicrobia bacterium]|nr:MAG: acetate kinase [Verrucomicrobiota bacterium]
MKILVPNLGSTSLKWRLFDFSSGDGRVLHKGGFERVTDYSKAIGDCLAQLKDAGHIHSEQDLAAVGFKAIMARGFNGCVRLNEEVVKAMEAFNGIAPAHNPPYITGIRLFAQRMPEVPLVALFETAFYQWVPEAAVRYAIPEEWYQMGVRRWGFHGASHKFIAERSAELLGREDVAERVRQLYVKGPEVRTASSALALKSNDTRGDNLSSPLRVISCHLGGSSSITGILNGVAIGTSMGLSPQSGLPQNNRVGELDSFALPFVMRSAGLTLDEAERLLCKESGLKALSGGFNDLRDIQTQAAQGNARAQLALDVLVYQARHWIGSLLFQLNGADTIVFTAGIGENRPALRLAICANAEDLGIVLDKALNEATLAKEGVISAASSRVKIMVIPTNEELVVAREAKRFLEIANTKNQRPGRAGHPNTGETSNSKVQTSKKLQASSPKTLAETNMEMRGFAGTLGRSADWNSAIHQTRSLRYGSSY